MYPKTGNFQKFQTRNPIVRKLFIRFFDNIRRRVASAPTGSMLDAGCGEGMTLRQLGDVLPPRITGFDINPACVAYTKSNFPEADITTEDIFELPYSEKDFDLVICLEVLEHLKNPRKAIANLHRVADKRLIFSVPHEPWFQLGSLLRAKHLSSLGNHPEHINHWSPRSFKEFLSEEFTHVEIDTAFPWIIAEVRLADL